MRLNFADRRHVALLILLFAWGSLQWFRFGEVRIAVGVAGHSQSGVSFSKLVEYPACIDNGRKQRCTCEKRRVGVPSGDTSSIQVVRAASGNQDPVDVENAEGRVKRLGKVWAIGQAEIEQVEMAGGSIARGDM